MDKTTPTNKRPILTLKNRQPVGKTSPLPVESVPSHQITQPAAPSKGSDTAAHDLSQWLSQQSPAWRNHLPLKLGVIQDIYTLLGENPPYSKRVIHKTLRWHTSRTQYLRNVLRHDLRYSLDGQPVGEVTADQYQHAQTELNKRRKNTGQ